MSSSSASALIPFIVGDDQQTYPQGSDLFQREWSDSISLTEFWKVGNPNR